ncbi:hypothetical protein SLA2020_360400 [Shorea laevis]
MSAIANPILNSQEADLLSRSVKRIKGDDNPPIAEEHLMFEAPQKQLSYRDMVSSLEPTAILCDSSNRDEILEEDSDMEDDGTIPTILISKEEKKRIRMPWLNSLIIKAFGTDKAGYNYIFPRIKAQWKPRGKMDCIDLGLDFFLIRFHEKEDLNRVLHGGPWFVGPHFLTIRRWEPSFDPAKATFKTTAIWARLPHLPIEYYDVQILERIGNILGTPLRLDAHTAHQSRGQYARICIQVDLDEPLVPFVRIGKHIQKVLYEGPAALCYECGCVGHKEDKCPLKIPHPMVVSEEQIAESQNSQDPVEKSSNDLPDNQGFGPWMLVERRKNKKKQSTTQLNNSVGRLTGSRNGSRNLNSKGNVNSDTTINVVTVATNGPVTASQPLSSNSKGHNISSPPMTEAEGPSHDPTHQSTTHTKQATKRTTTDKFTISDKISPSLPFTRGKSPSKRSTTQTRNSQNVKNSTPARSASPRASSDHGSHHIHQAQPHVGCSFDRQEQQVYLAGRGSSVDFRQKPTTDKGMVARDSSKLLAQAYSCDERSGSHPLSSSPNGCDPTASGAPVSRFMYHSEGSLDITGGDTEMGQLVGTNSSQVVHNAGATPIPMSIQDDRMHEDCASYSQEGGITEHSVPIQADCAAVLLPGGQYDGFEQGRPASVAPRTSQVDDDHLQ